MVQPFSRLINFYRTKNESIPAMETNSSKLILTETNPSQKKPFGVAGSSVLMGNTAMFSPQNITLPKVKVSKHSEQ